MKIPVFECFCGNCGQSRVVALNGSKAPERCPGCGSPERFKIKFLEPESLTMPDIGKRNAPLPGRLTVMKTPPVIQKFEAIVSGIAVLPTVGQAAFVLISGMETPNEKCFVSIENLSNAIAKDIRIGDTVEVQGDKILRVLLEKRGGNNAEEKS